MGSLFLGIASIINLGRCQRHIDCQTDQTTLFEFVLAILGFLELSFLIFLAVYSYNIMSRNNEPNLRRMVKYNIVPKVLMFVIGIIIASIYIDVYNNNTPKNDKNLALCSFIYIIFIGLYVMYFNNIELRLINNGFRQLIN